MESMSICRRSDRRLSLDQRPYHFLRGQTSQEQRRYERVAFYCPLQLTVLPEGPTVAGRSFDISLGGVGVIADVFLERGQTVQVSFGFPDGPRKEAEEGVLGRVAYSRADEDGNRIGIEFLETIHESAQPLLARKLNNL